MSTKIKTPDGWKDVAGGSLTPPEGFIQNVDTGMQPVEDGKVMRISKTAFDALAQRDTNVMYYLDEEHDLIDAKPTCRDVDGNLVKGQKIVELTKEQYDALAVKDPDTYYMIADDTIVKAWHPRPDWANAVDITPDQIYAGYEVPDDGTLVLKVGPGYAGSRTFYIDDIEVGGYSTSNTANMSTLTFPICKGQVIKSSSRSNSCKFVPWKA